VHWPAAHAQLWRLALPRPPERPTGSKFRPEIKGLTGYTTYDIIITREIIKSLRLKMAGRHAKTLTKQQLAAALRRAAYSRYPERNRIMVLLSAKAGLRAGEIAKLTWPMVVDAEGRIASHIELHDAAAKKRSGRTIPLHPDLRRPLRRLQQQHGARGPVIRSERGQALRPSSVVNWFGRLYRELGFEGCTSHSGRRTFITNAARLVFKAGGSLRDVQQLAGHRSIEHTQAYIDGDTRAKRRLVNLL
jgi:integrase